VKKKADYTGKKILAVLAHPDDESFGMGGTLAYYARHGAQVDLVCATRGEAGDVDDAYLDDVKSVACLRTQELKCAAGFLGLHEVIFLNYRDSGMSGSVDNTHPNALAAQAIPAVAQKIAHIIRQVRPDVVLTFDPIGGYRHPDHIAAHQATVSAFGMAAGFEPLDDPQDLPLHQADHLYFHTIQHTYLKMAVFFMRLFGKDPHHFGKNRDIDIASLVAVKFPVNVRVNYREVARARERAAACHASQGGSQMSKGFRGFIARVANGTTDTFMQAYPLVEKRKKVRKDLF